MSTMQENATQDVNSFVSMEPTKANTSLFTKMSKVMGKMGWIEKTGYNAFHKYNYVEESAIVDRVRNAMVEEGLVLTMDVGDFTINGDIAVARVHFTIACNSTGFG